MMSITVIDRLVVIKLYTANYRLAIKRNVNYFVRREESTIALQGAFTQSAREHTKANLPITMISSALSFQQWTW